METIGEIVISQSLLNKLGLPPQSQIRVRVGNKAVFAKLTVQQRTGNTYLLSPSLIKALHLKKRKPLRIRYHKEENTIHIGPTIGIFTTHLPSQGIFEPTSLQAELIYLSNVAKSLPGQIFIFTSGSVDWKTNTVRGYTYKPVSGSRGVWVASTYPLPDVVYDRITTRRGEARMNIKKTKNRLLELPYTKYFNPSFLNKWEVHQMLETNPLLHEYLPETRELNLENLTELLMKYRTVFIKPSDGSLGMKIIKAHINQNRQIDYIVYRGGIFRRAAKNPEELLRQTSRLRQGKPYIVQQGLELARYRRHSFDIRIIYQKNSQGDWQISKKLARIAPGGSSISNLSSGGKVVRSRIVLKYLLRKDQKINTCNEEIRKLCYLAASTLEKSSKKNFGELGLDIGIDRKGHPWLIEVNSKPRKTTETVFSQAIMRNTFKRPLEYAIHLAGF
ncbi:MAG: YheC/YheD family protein [Syntrophomonadaceae bacterium]|jgi:glutathione synthase/RimK-type ligase-like ATP-grasp enzyme